MASRIRVLAACVLLALLVAAAAGCGSSKSSSSTTTTAGAGTATTTSQGRQALAAFQSCLASHGVTLGGQFGGRPPGGQGSNGQPPSGTPPQGQPPTGQGRPALTAKQQKAFTACRSKLPAGAGRFGQGAPTGGQSNAAFAKYTRCLRQHGVTFGATNNQAAFSKARAACAKYAPTLGAGTGSGS